jgi:hypothetical protein
VPRHATRFSRSFFSAKALQTKQGSCSVGGLAPATYDKRQGAHKRSIRGSFPLVPKLELGNEGLWLIVTRQFTILILCPPNERQKMAWRYSVRTYPLLEHRRRANRLDSKPPLVPKLELGNEGRFERTLSNCYGGTKLIPSKITPRTCCAHLGAHHAYGISQAPR